MYSEFPKLKANFEQLKWKLDIALREAIETYGLEDVELIISEVNFVERSPITQVASHLRETLESCLDAKGEIDVNQIDEEHIAAAQGLLKLNKFQETAIKFLSKALILKPNQDDLDLLEQFHHSLRSDSTNIISSQQINDASNSIDKQKARIQSIRKLVIETFSECSSEISRFENSRNLVISPFSLNERAVSLDQRAINVYDSSCTNSLRTVYGCFTDPETGDTVCGNDKFQICGPGRYKQVS